MPASTTIKAAALAIAVRDMPLPGDADFWPAVSALHGLISACAGDLQAVLNDPRTQVSATCSTELGLTAAFLQRAGDHLAAAWLAGAPPAAPIQNAA